VSKFLAMLKDSYKEAVDGWIFVVMLGLAGLLVVLVGTLSVSPLPPDQAYPKMLAQLGADRGGPRMIPADRGNGPRQAMFFYTVEMTDLRAAEAGDRPWEAKAAFTLEFKGTGMGPAGAEVELDEKGQPKIDKDKLEDIVVMGDPFREAVRYWAAKPGEKKPDYTVELAREFVKAQVEDATRLTVSAVEPVAAGKGGGLLDAFKAAPGAKFNVSVDGAPRVAWSHRPALFFGAWSLSFLELPLGLLIHLVEDTLLNGIGGWVVLLAGVIVTAGFIPNMLRKGAIDLLLTKPLSRPLVLLYKYLGGLLFVVMLTAVAVGGVWLMIGLKTGVWAPGVLYAIGGITFYFAILYACSTLAGSPSG
jgi:hypothetical protein